MAAVLDGPDLTKTFAPIAGQGRNSHRADVGCRRRYDSPVKLRFRSEIRVFWPLWFVRGRCQCGGDCALSPVLQHFAIFPTGCRRGDSRRNVDAATTGFNYALFGSLEGPTHKHTLYGPRPGVQTAPDKVRFASFQISVPNCTVQTYDGSGKFDWRFLRGIGGRLFVRSFAGDRKQS